MSERAQIEKTGRNGTCSACGTPGSPGVVLCANGYQGWGFTICPSCAGKLAALVGSADTPTPGRLRAWAEWARDVAWSDVTFRNVSGHWMQAEVSVLFNALADALEAAALPEEGASP